MSRGNGAQERGRLPEWIDALLREVVRLAAGQAAAEQERDRERQRADAAEEEVARLKELLAVQREERWGCSAERMEPKRKPAAEEPTPGRELAPRRI